MYSNGCEWDRREGERERKRERERGGADLLLAVLAGPLVAPGGERPLGLGAALQEGAAALHPVLHHLQCVLIHCMEDKQQKNKVRHFHGNCASMLLVRPSKVPKKVQRRGDGEKLVVQMTVWCYQKNRLFVVVLFHYQTSVMQATRCRYRWS